MILLISRGVVAVCRAAVSSGLLGRALRLGAHAEAGRPGGSPVRERRLLLPSRVQPYLTLACLALFLSGCAPADTGPRGKASRARVLYESQGELLAVKTLGSFGKEQVFIWEGFRSDDEFMEPRGVLRSFRLDPSTGRTHGHWEHAFSEASWGWAGDGIAVSADGRRVAQLDFGPGAEGSRVWVADAEGGWAQVRPFDSQFRLLPRWSPNGDVLAYIATTLSRSGVMDRDAVALPVPRPAAMSAEIVLTPDGHVSNEVAWAHDSRRVYLLSVEPDVGEYLEAVDWPSLERRRLFAGPGLRYLSVASRTGDLVFQARAASEAASQAESEAKPEADSEAADSTAGDSGRPVWRLSPDGKLQQTPVTHRGALPPQVISPDGSHLAVVPRAEGEGYGQGLIVYSMQDGAAETFAELEGKSIRHIDWVLGGRAVLAVDSDERVWLAAVDGDLPEIAPVKLEPPSISSFAPDPEQQSRNNLRKLSEALLTYVVENDCMFPDLGDMDAVAAALAPYLEGDDVFIDPRTRQPYGGNPSLSDKCDVEFDHQLDFIVFYETTPGEDGGRNVAFLLGGVDHVSNERWQQLKKRSRIE